MSLVDRSPVFVVGAPRSGSTWVKQLLTAHPAIVGGQDSHFFSGYLAPLWQRWQMERELGLGRKTLGVGCYFTEDEFLEELRRLARRLFTRLLETKPGARLLIEKTPDHGLHIPLIERLFPQATFIHVLRDGRDLAAFVKGAPPQPWGPTWAPASIEDAARHWVRSVSQIRKDLTDSERARTIRYEDLLTNGPAVLGDLYQFLGVRLPQKQVMAIHDRCRLDGGPLMVETSPVRDDVGQETESGEHKGLNPNGQAAWQIALSSSEQASVQSIAGDLLAELGYPPTPAPVDDSSSRFVSIAPPDDVLWSKPKRLGILDSSHAQMLQRERLYLYATIMALAPERCLEIGVSQGGSTLIIHAALKDLGRGRLISLDPAPRLTYPKELLEDVVTFLTGASPESLEKTSCLAGGLFDFVLVDGDHSVEAVRADLAGVAAIARPGAKVLLHDAYCPSVAAGIDAALAAGLPYADAGIVSSTRHRGLIANTEVEFAGFRLLVRNEASAVVLDRAA